MALLMYCEFDNDQYDWDTVFPFTLTLSTESMGVSSAKVVSKDLSGCKIEIVGTSNIKGDGCHYIVQQMTNNNTIEPMGSSFEDGVDDKIILKASPSLAIIKISVYDAN